MEDLELYLSVQNYKKDGNIEKPMQFLWISTNHHP